MGPSAPGKPGLTQPRLQPIGGGPLLVRPGGTVSDLFTEVFRILLDALRAERIIPLRPAAARQQQTQSGQEWQEPFHIVSPRCFIIPILYPMPRLKARGDHWRMISAFSLREGVKSGAPESTLTRKIGFHQRLLGKMAKFGISFLEKILKKPKSQKFFQFSIDKRKTYDIIASV